MDSNLASKLAGPAYRADRTQESAHEAPHPMPRDEPSKKDGTVSAMLANHAIDAMFEPGDAAAIEDDESAPAASANPGQVVSEGFGDLKPLDANVRPDGSDNPDGRSHNRRTEIYLDF